MSLISLRRRMALELPLRIGDHRPAHGDGVEAMVDWDMEAAGVGAWTPSNATLTKEPGTAPSGGGGQVLRLTQTIDATSAIGYQPATITIGAEYVVDGWARSNGVLIPGLRDGAVSYVWQGTTGTAWQRFRFVYTAAAASLILRSLNAMGLAGDYVEFAHVSVQRISPRSLNRGAAGEDLDAIFADGATTPTKLAHRRGYGFAGAQAAWMLMDAPQPNVLSALSLPLTVGFVGRCTASFSGDGGGWRAVQTVLELRNESAAANRRVSFNIGFDLNTISIGRGGVKWNATRTLSVNRRYTAMGVFDETNYYLFVDGLPCGSGAHGGGAQDTGGEPAIVSNCTLGCRTTDLGAVANLLTGEVYHGFVSAEAFTALDAAEYHYWYSRLCGRARETA